MGNRGFPLDAYLRRVGLSSGRAPDLAALHRAHVTAIPFENLDPHRGVAPSLAPEALAAKLIDARRGGYCFEHNLLLAAALEALGARVELMLARVRLGRPPGRISPRTHLALRVEWEGAVWLADVGFGNGTMLEPIPFGPGDAHDQSGWRFRVVGEGGQHVLQSVRDGVWLDLYAFVPEPVPFIDLETSNWFTASHPRSPFVTGLIVTRVLPDGTRVQLSDWEGLGLKEQTPDAVTVAPVRREEIGQLLAERFGLPGFAVGGDGRVCAISPT